MIRITAPDAEVRPREEVLRTAADPTLRHRAPVVLRAHRGRRRPAIAADSGTSQRPVPRWLNADRENDAKRIEVPFVH